MEHIMFELQITNEIKSNKINQHEKNLYKSNQI